MMKTKLPMINGRFHWWYWSTRGRCKFLQATRPENIEHYHKFPDEDDKPYFGEEDTQTELYAPENRDFAAFDKFAGFEKSV